MLIINIIQLVYWSYLVRKFNETQILYPENLLRRTLRRPYRVPYSKWCKLFANILRSFYSLCAWVPLHLEALDWRPQRQATCTLAVSEDQRSAPAIPLPHSRTWILAICMKGHTPMQIHAPGKILLELGSTVMCWFRRYVNWRVPWGSPFPMRSLISDSATIDLVWSNVLWVFPSLRLM